MVSLRILTVVIHLIMTTNIGKRRLLLAAQPVGAGRRAGEGAAGGGGGAAANLEVVVVGDEGLVSVVSLVLAVVGGPRRGIPYRTVYPHRPQWKRVVAFTLVSSYWHIVHVKSAFIYKINN